MTEQEKILQAITGLVGDMKTLSDDVKADRKTAAEERQKIEQFEARFNAIEAAKKEEAKKLPTNAPLDTKTGDTLASKVGFKGLSIRKALDLPLSHAMVRSGDKEELKNLHDYHDACVFKFYMLKRRTDHTTAWKTLQEDVDYKTYRDILDRNGFLSRDKEIQLPVRKANEVIHPDSSGIVSTLDFVLTSATLIDKMRLDLVVANLFREITLTRPTQKFPVRTGDGFGVLGGTSGTVPPLKDHATTMGIPSTAYFTNPTFGTEKTFDVKHLLTFIEYNDDSIEDSIIPLLPMLQEDISYFSARTLDRAILDGDTTGTHMDDDVTAATDFRKAFYGLRIMAANNFVDAGGVADDADLHDVRAKLGIYGKNPARCAYIASLSSMYGLIKLGVLNTNVNVNLPSSALANTGLVSNWWGVPFYVSEFVRTDVNGTTGFNDSSGNTKGVLYCVNTDRFVRARYGPFQIEDTRVAPMLYTILQADVRLDFGAWDEHALTSGSFAANVSPVAMLRNITV